MPTPALVFPGNHDIPGLNQPFDRFFRPFHRYQKTFGEELQPEFLADGIHVVSLNSTRTFGLHADWSEGKLSESQLHRAESRFAVGLPALRVLMLHHPLMAPAGHGRAVVDPLPDVLGLIARSRVDLILCGHFHRSHLATIGPDESWHGIVSQTATVCSTACKASHRAFMRFWYRVIKWKSYVTAMSATASFPMPPFPSGAKWLAGACRIRGDLRESIGHFR